MTARTPPRAAAAGLALAVFAACEIPTEAPRLHTTWTVPGERTVVTVAELLPSGVREADDGEAFEVEPDPARFERTLGELCGTSCELVDGLIAPKPAFRHREERRPRLPDDVVEAGVDAGRVRVRVDNGLAFDPVRPGGGETGVLRVTVRDGPEGRRIAEWVLDGAERALPSGAVTTETVELEPGPAGPEWVAVMELESPEGSPVRIDVSERLDVEVEPSGVRAGWARIDASGWSVEAEPSELDVGDLDRDFVDAVRSARLRLEVTNPFAVGVDATLRIRGDGFEPVIRSLAIPGEPSATVPVTFGRDELQRFLGRSGVVLEAEGVVDPEAEPVRVEPGQSIVLEGPLEIDLEIGGGGR